MEDILCLIDEPENKINQLHTEINTIHKNIKFTLEKERAGQINFLNKSIIKKITYTHSASTEKSLI